MLMFVGLSEKRSKYMNVLILSAVYCQSSIPCERLQQRDEINMPLFSFSGLLVTKHVYEG